MFASGHYDILYKFEDVPQPKPQPPLMVNLATGRFEEHMHERPGWHDLGGPDFGVPGMSFASPGQVPWSYNPLYDFSAAPGPTLQQAIPVPAYAPLSVAAPRAELMPQPASQDMQVGVPTIQHQLSMIDRVGPFRPSKFELETNYSSGTLHHTQFVTSAFKKYVSFAPSCFLRRESTY